MQRENSIRYGGRAERKLGAMASSGKKSWGVIIWGEFGLVNFARQEFRQKRSRIRGGGAF